MKKLTRENYELCDKITTRAMEMNLYPSDHRITAIMDIQNAAKFFNMCLEEWLEADDFDFAHDIIGIAKAINRVTYPVDFSNDPLFLPRFAGKEEQIMRKVIVILEVNDDRAIEENMGTLDYLEREIGWIEESGIYMKNARILDEDDLCDIEAIKMSNMIFNFNKED